MLPAEPLCDPIRHHLGHASLEVPMLGRGKCSGCYLCEALGIHQPWPSGFLMGILLGKLKLCPERALSAGGRLRRRKCGSSIATEQAGSLNTMKPSLLCFTLNTSTQSLSITGDGEGPQRGFRGWLPLFPSPPNFSFLFLSLLSSWAPP